MAQVTDRTVGANPSGFNMRTELNNIIGALETCNSGTSEPLNTVAYMDWFDTSNATYYYLKKRNHDNTAWNTILRYTVATKLVEFGANALTATQLATERTINGVSFNGSANINIEGRLATAVASATTTTIGTVGSGETVHITGTTTITSLGVSTTGTIRNVVFDGALVLTYNATSLILPTSANITTAANDMAIFICENGASGYWRCIGYLRRTGVPLTLGSLSTTGSAATLTTARNISGVSFNGSANIEIEDRLGTAIASAATTTVGTVGLGDYIHITGTTTITSFGTAGRVGVRRTLIFDSAGVVITHNATSLICTGAENITTVAGTVIEVVAETTANWRVVSITHPSVSATELGYLDGVTSSVQTQINTLVAVDDALKDVPQNAQTAAYTLALTDRGKSIDVSTGGITITVPLNSAVAFPIGATVSITNLAATAITVSSSATLRQAGTANTGSRTLAAYGMATLRKVATDTWFISGAGLS